MMQREEPLSHPPDDARGFMWRTSYYWLTLAAALTLVGFLVRYDLF
jgi:hypothetical protein